MSHVSSVYFRGRDAGIDLAERALASSRGLRVELTGGQLVVRWRDGGPVLHIGFNGAEWVREKASQFGEGTPHASGLAACDARFEIVLDDLDEVLDEANTLIEVQLCLQHATHGYVLNSWNGQMLPPTT